MKQFLIIICFFLSLLSANFLVANEHHKDALAFVENKGQWESNILFEATIPNGKLFLERDGITFLLYQPEDISRIHGLHHGEIKNPTREDYLINCHAYKMNFENSNPALITLGNEKTEDYVNYFIGNDRAKWASNVSKFGVVTYKNIYPDIDFKIYSHGTDIKYDFIVRPGGDPGDIAYSFDGLNEIEHKNDRIFLKTSVNEMVDNAPYSYQATNKNIPTKYLLKNKTVSFDLDSYDNTETLVIDPLLVFASYSGSTSDNWGYTATFDESGHLYAGGVTFGGGYPATLGAFQITFNGGLEDISIMKYAPNGQSLIYSTYLGGSNTESPHSLIVNSDNELYVFGTTSSSNYPTSVGCYDSTFNGGVATNASYVSYSTGSDIIITKFSVDGTLINGSTYVGGALNDGLSLGSLRSNYADDFRGEIIIDNGGNCIVASTTYSKDFPISAGAAQDTLTGSQDGIVFKLNPNLSNLVWSTYIGGTEEDAVYGVQFNKNGETYVAGGTNSSNFPITSGTINSVFNGVTDGFITKINNAGSQFVYSTFVGTSEHDQAYFVQLDSTDNVYVVGQTEGNYSVQPATVYSNPNSGQFLHKLTPELDSTIFSTVIGTGSGGVDIALSAFLVNSCNQIYISGWGGFVNANYGGPATSTTAGLPITADAFQSNTDGSDFYLMVLAENATALQYATFFGGGTSFEHVDGGTSRFDKNGIVYQAVCGGCGGNSDFPVTSGAWSETNNASNCNVATFKFDLSLMSASAAIAQPLLCAPANATFQNNSNGGQSYFWDFGDGTTSTDHSPSHVYADTGTYVVSLVVFDPASCIFSDTSSIELNIALPPSLTVTSDASGCVGSFIDLFATGTPEYSWEPAIGLSNPNISNPTVLIDTVFQYTVTGINQCGSDSKIVSITPYYNNTSISPDTSICKGNSFTVTAFGGITYNWIDNGSIINLTSNEAIATPSQTTTYFVEIADTNGCFWTKNTTLEVDTVIPILTLSPDTAVCIGDTATFQAGGGTFYFWETDAWISTNDSSIVETVIFEDKSYFVTTTNGCGSASGVILVSVSLPPTLNIMPELNACPNDSVQLFSSGAENYLWTPSYGLSDSTISNPMAMASTFVEYKVTGTNICGIDEQTVIVSAYKDYTTVSPDSSMCLGYPFSISATGGYSYTWNDDGYISDPSADQPIVNPPLSTSYFVTISDYHDCLWVKDVKVIVDTVIAVVELPNDTSICSGDTIELLVTGGTYYKWNSTAWMNVNDSSLIQTAPLATTSYLITTTNGCGSSTGNVNVTVSYPPSLNVTPTVYGCPNEEVQLNSSEAPLISWEPTAGLSNPTISNPTTIVVGNFQYTVTGTNQCGNDQEIVTIISNSNETDISPDSSLCIGSSLVVNATGGVDYSWLDNGYIFNKYSDQAIVNPIETTTYYVSITDANNCLWLQNVTIIVDTALPVISVPNDFKICFGDTVFIEASGGTYYTWYSDSWMDNNDSASVKSAPIENTTYNVTTTNGCGSSEGVLNISVSIGPELNVTTIIYGCPNDSVQLYSSGAPTLYWTPSAGLNNTQISSPMAFLQSNIEYIVTGINDCGTVRDTVSLIVYEDNTTIDPDTMICIGQQVLLNGYGGVAYNWLPEDLVTNNTSPQASAYPQTSTIYFVNITDSNNCIWNKSMEVDVDLNLPVANVSPDTTICYGDTIFISATGGLTYKWASNVWISSDSLQNFVTSPDKSAYYDVSVTNGCGTDEAQVLVNVNQIISNLTADTAACLGDSLTLHASGGLVYIWNHPNLLDDYSSSSPSLIVTEPNLFKVKIIDDLLCELMDSIYVDTLQQAYVDAGEEIIIEFGDYGELFPFGDGKKFNWSPSEFTDCDTCFYPGVNPNETMYFTITLTDQNGCKATDSVLVFVTGNIYVANTFTPNGDGNNDIFYAFGEEIATFKMYIFSRWGDIIFESNDINFGWDGKIKNSAQVGPEGIYIWKIEYSETSGDKGSMVGHVTLLK